MSSGLVSISAPQTSIYRVARRGADPFGPPPWEYAADDGTFGNRFDDPGGRVDPAGQREVISAARRFRVIYCASTAAGAFGETLAHLRPAISEPFIDPDYEDDPDDPESLSARVDGTRDPADARRGLISAEWRSRRVIATTHLDRSLVFANLASPATLNQLRASLAPVAHALGLADIDFGTVLSSVREFTQECARFIHELADEHGHPRYAGIRYLSRLNPNWECWAIFDDRIRNSPARLESILPDHPALHEVAALYRLTIETSAGLFIRPD